MKTVICVILLIQMVILLVNMIQRQTVVQKDSKATEEKNSIEVSTATPPDNDTLEIFLTDYEEYCERNLLPKTSNFLGSYVNNGTSLCACVPDSLEGPLNVSTLQPLPIGEMELRQTELTPGGTWAPASCQPRHRVAVIIPFRDREEHLLLLLNILHPMLQRQLLHYTIFVIEQSRPAVFNKAALMNTGFMEARSVANFDCYIFHDVDMLPEDDRNFYSCSEVPRHVGSHIDKWDYIVPYPGIFGGVTAFTRALFEMVNGFSNEYYGWGGEDDDMFSRIRARNLTIARFSKTVARYTMIKHKSDAGNPYNVKSGIAWKFRPQQYRVDGLNSLRYKLVEFEPRPLYSWMLVALPPHPSYFKRAYRGVSQATAARPAAVFAYIGHLALGAVLVRHNLRLR